MPIRRWQRMILVAGILTVVATTFAVGPATADERGTDLAPAGTAAPGRQLPQGFPDDLRRFVAGTDEFKSAPWFTDGPCRDRGGDLGAYLAAMFPVEERLIYWQLDDADKAKLWPAALSPGGVPGPQVQQAITSGAEPAHHLMPTVFPGDDTTFAPPQGKYCAEDLDKWGTPSASNAWGFDWAATADAASQKLWAQLPNAGDVPNGAWADPCGAPDVPAIYCMHAYFVNCDQVQNDPRQYTACLSWNEMTGKLSVGTAHWLAEQRSVWDRVAPLLATGAVAPLLVLGHPVVMAWAGLYGTVKAVGKFVENAVDGVDDLANKLHEAAVEVSQAVLSNLATTGQFDPTWSWFLTKYAQSAAIGIVLMAFMCIHTVARSARHGTPGELAAALGAYLPLALTAQAFAPAFASLLIVGTNALADDVARASGADAADMATGVYNATNIQATAVPGGAVFGIGIFACMLIGAVAIWVGQQMHAIGLPIVGVVVAISFGLWVSPKYRHKAIRPVLVFLSIVFSKVLLFVLLGTVFALSAAKLGSTDDPLGAFGAAAFVALAMMVAGFAPWALLKWVPFLPSASDSNDFGSGPPVAAAVVGGAGGAVMYLNSKRRGDAGADTPRSSGSGGSLAASGAGAAPASAPGTGGAGSGSGTGSQPGPIEHAWSQRRTSAATPGASTVGSAANAGRAGTTTSGAGTAAGGAARVGASAAGAATTVGISVAAQAAAAAMTKTKSAAENHPPRAEDTRDDK